MNDDRYKQTRPRMKETEKDGVIYTPGRTAHAKPPAAKPSSQRPRPAGRRAPSRRAKKTNFAPVFAATVVAGVLISVIAFALVFNAFSKSSKSPGQSGPAAVTPPPIQEPVVEEVSAKGVGVIRAINFEQKTFEAYIIDDNKSISLAAAAGTSIKNKYGESLVFAELKRGDIVDLSYDDGGLLTSVATNPQAFELSKVSDLKIDIEEKLITTGNDHYSFSDKTEVYNKGEAYSIGLIDPIDVVTLKGYKNVIYYAEVNKSHGYLSFTSKEDIINGTLEIDTNIYRALEESDEFKLLEGRHKVVIKGANIEPFSREINLTEEEHLTIDLHEVQLKAGFLIVNANVDGATLKVDGVERPIGEPLVLNHGEYTISVTKDNYTEYSETVDFDSAELKIDAELIELPSEDPAAAKTKKLEIITTPPGADIYIGTAFRGISPLTVELEYGTYRIYFRKEGYIETDYSLTIDENYRSPGIDMQLQDASLALPIME